MKKIIYLLAAAPLMMLFSCLKDLDTLPLNENDFVADKAYGTPESYLQGLAKIYGGFCLIGQGENDSPGAAENNLPGGGASELNRAWWSLQELSTDAGKVAWVNDGWTAELNTNTWTTVNNTNIYAIYNRTMLNVSLVNEYLRQTADSKLDSRGTDATLRADIQKYRSEARLLRAYNYWMAMDVFGGVPFFTENDPVGMFYPPEKSRVEIFEWIESELLALTTDANLADARSNTYPRVDKGLAWGLLARMYLNAEVYTGKARWADAKSAAAGVIAAGYGLAANYAEIFMGDNGENADVRRELIFASAYDKDKTRSDGGTSFLVNAALGGNDPDAGDLTGSKTWGGIRTTWEYASTMFGITDPDYDAGTYTTNDSRAMFYIKGRQEEMLNTGDFYQGWSCIKYTKHSSTGVKNNTDFNSADYPMMRLAEIYLIYAEATIRAAGSTSGTDATAIGYLNQLRQRGQIAYSPLTTYDLIYVLEERARELMWEGHRRTDLIRYNMYTGGAYNWPWKGGVLQGRAIDARYNLCPIPIEDIRLNPNLTPTPGYTY